MGYRVVTPLDLEIRPTWEQPATSDGRTIPFAYTQPDADLQLLLKQLKLQLPDQPPPMGNGMDAAVRRNSVADHRIGSERIASWHSAETYRHSGE